MTHPVTARDILRIQEDSMARRRYQLPPEISAYQASGIPSVDEMYECPYCGRRFFLLANLEWHWNSEHSGLAEPLPTDEKSTTERSGE